MPNTRIVWKRGLNRMRDPEDVGGLKIHFQWCRELRPPHAARKALAAIQRSGAWSERVRLQPDADYFSSIAPDGSATLLPLDHPSLEPDSSTVSHIKHGLL